MACETGYFAMRFNETNPRAVRWAKNRSARLVVEITREARVAIRRVIERAFIEGIPPAQAGRLIRSIVGLTERDALAVMRRQVELMQDGYTPSRAQAMAEAYARKLHRARALTIARTETMAASNHGQQELWDQAVERGYIPSTFQKMWITQLDEFTCPICAPMNGVRVGVQESFSIGDPPAHPRCRCTMGLVERGRRR